MGRVLLSDGMADYSGWYLTRRESLTQAGATMEMPGILANRTAADQEGNRSIPVCGAVG
jgi:hypothetical protein